MSWRCLLGVFVVASILESSALIFSDVASAQAPGPLQPHVGASVTTSFSNTYGPDAEATTTFTSLTPEVLAVRYSSTRGLIVQRDILIRDRDGARTYVLGYAQNMPQTIPGATSLGISSTTLVELRTNGRTALSLIYDEKMSKLDGELTLVEKDIRIPLLIEDQLVEVPAVRATGTFVAGDKRGAGDFYFLDNQNNPMMLESTLQFSWEKQPRAERITRVAAAASMRSAMEQALSTVRKYDLYGIHFDFDKATLRPDAAGLIGEIAITLKNNPSWRLQINGHTDSIGNAGYNQKLSAQRAASVASAIIGHGVGVGRLTVGGFGSSQPKGDNATLQGRALNRRVELIRTDR